MADQMGVQNNPPVIVPWYEETDFAELMAISGSDGSPDETYELWYRRAMQRVDDLLRSGEQVAFITIRPAAYFCWLGGRRNTLEMRRRYAEYLATASDAAAA